MGVLSKIVVRFPPQIIPFFGGDFHEIFTIHFGVFPPFFGNSHFQKVVGWVPGMGLVFSVPRLVLGPFPWVLFFFPDWCFLFQWHSQRQPRIRWRCQRYWLILQVPKKRLIIAQGVKTAPVQVEFIHPSYPFVRPILLGLFHGNWPKDPLEHRILTP